MLCWLMGKTEKDPHETPLSTAHRLGNVLHEMSLKADTSPAWGRPRNLARITIVIGSKRKAPECGLHKWGALNVPHTSCAIKR